MLKTSSPRAVASALTGGLVALLLLAGARPAAADPVTYTNNATGATVTLSSGWYAAGGRLVISGTGFTRASGTGQPIVAIKPDEHDEAAEVRKWTAGGADALDPIDVGGGEWVLAFAARNDGTFSGWIDLPDDLPLTGAGTGPNAGQHVLRLLSGLLSTDGQSPTDPNNIGVYFQSMDFALGLLSASSAFYAGDTFPAGASVVPRGGGAFPPGAPVGVTLDGGAWPGGAPAITTDGAGKLPAGARLPLPAGLAPGRHEVSLRTGTVELTQPFVVGSAAGGAIVSAGWPGGTLSFTGAGFAGLRGGGQKVAVMVGALGVKACVTAGADGSLSGSVAIPADATAEQVTPLRLLAGTSCVPGGEQDDLPARAVTLPVTLGTAPAPPVLPGPPAPGPSPAPAPAPKPAPAAAATTPKPSSLKITNKGRTLRLALAAGTSTKVKVSIATAGQVRTSARGKAKVMSLIAPRTLTPKAGRATSANLTLTATGRALLKRYRSLRVVVRVAPVGAGAAATRRLTLRA